MPNELIWDKELVDKFWSGFSKTDLVDIAFGKLAGPKFIELVLPFLSLDRTILDFGAGDGDVLELLLDRGYSCAGFDPSGERQATLKARLQRKEKFLGIIDSDSDEQFDVVFAMEVIEHILDDDFDQVIKRLAGFVKPGGYLITSTPNNENMKYAKVYCPVSDTLFHPWQHIRNFTHSQVTGIFSNMGYIQEYIALADFSSDADVYEKYKEYARRQNFLEASYERSKQLIYLSDELLMSVDRDLSVIDGFLRVGENLTLFNKLLLRLKIILKHRKIIGKLHRISHDSKENMVKLHNNLAEQSSIVLGDEGRSDQAQGSETPVLIGRGTTIVYVGKKCVE